MISLDKVKAVQATAELLVDRPTLQVGFDRMAGEMKEVLSDQNPLLLCVMNGGLLAMSELLTRLDFPLQCDYIHATRYRGETSGGASLHWKHFPSSVLENRVVVVVDDILDGGVTLSAIVDYCEAQKAEKVYTAVMLDKPEGRAPGGLPKADFVGVEIPDRFVFGYGLDYFEYLRNAPGIYAVADEHL
jgi:hypoxanthine phosphoribosyltransferase